MALRFPSGKDRRFNIVVAPESTRNRISTVSILTLTTGRRSQCSKGISSTFAAGALGSGFPCADIGNDKAPMKTGISRRTAHLPDIDHPPIYVVELSPE